jgi:hypothetical protein
VTGGGVGGNVAQGGSAGFPTVANLPAPIMGGDGGMSNEGGFPTVANLPVPIIVGGDGGKGNDQ